MVGRGSPVIVESRDSQALLAIPASQDGPVTLVRQELQVTVV